MMDNSVIDIKIIKAFPFSGKDSLEERLQRVSLRGFPEVKVYEKASFDYAHYDSRKAKAVLSVSQPHVHQAHMDRINRLDKMFQAEGVDIFNLTQAYDYLALNKDGQPTEWTMLPPVVEVIHIPRHVQGGFDYDSLIGSELRKVLKQNGWELNDAANTAQYHQSSGVYHLINDGAHRVEAGLRSGRGIRVIEIQNMTPGYPYYAIPQPYDSVRTFPDEATSEDLKVHVVSAPAHKQLYRLFPSGGIRSGEIRPARPGEVIV